MPYSDVYTPGRQHAKRRLHAFDGSLSDSLIDAFGRDEVIKGCKVAGIALHALHVSELDWEADSIVLALNDVPTLGIRIHRDGRVEEVES